MKKKEVLIIFILAVLVTVVLAYLFSRDYCIKCGEGFQNERYCVNEKGWPWIFLSNKKFGMGCYPEGMLWTPMAITSIWDLFDPTIFLVDTFFWFLVSASIWFLFKKLRKRGD